jgi:hypothetical protein
MLLHAIIVDVYPILLLQAWKHGCGERAASGESVMMNKKYTTSSY